MDHSGWGPGEEDTKVRIRSTTLARGWFDGVVDTVREPLCRDTLGRYMLPRHSPLLTMGGKADSLPPRQVKAQWSFALFIAQELLQPLSNTRLRGWSIRARDVTKSSSRGLPTTELFPARCQNIFFNFWSRHFQVFLIRSSNINNSFNFQDIHSISSSQPTLIQCEIWFIVSQRYKGRNFHPAWPTP